MNNDKVWDFVDYQGNPLPKPHNWDDNPEWFNTKVGRAVRIYGPRINGVGPVEWRRELGEYTVICYRDDRVNYSWAQQTEHGNLLYTAWVGGKQVDVHWESLDEMLVDMIRFKHEGQRGSSGPRATEYFLKMIQED